MPSLLAPDVASASSSPPLGKQRGLLCSSTLGPHSGGQPSYCRFPTSSWPGAAGHSGECDHRTADPRQASDPPLASPPSARPLAQRPLREGHCPVLWLPLPRSPLELSPSRSRAAAAGGLAGAASLVVWDKGCGAEEPPRGCRRLFPRRQEVGLQLEAGGTETRFGVTHGRDFQSPVGPSEFLGHFFEGVGGCCGGCYPQAPSRSPHPASPLQRAFPTQP